MFLHLCCPNNCKDRRRTIFSFQMLNQMGEFVAKPKYGLAASKENMHKNRSKESLPGKKPLFSNRRCNMNVFLSIILSFINYHLSDDDHLEYLTDYVPGRNQYINAVHMSVCGHQCSYLTQRQNNCILSSDLVICLHFMTCPLTA